jgi:hypothetical protein
LLIHLAEVINQFGGNNSHYIIKPIASLPSLSRNFTAFGACGESTTLVRPTGRQACVNALRDGERAFISALFSLQLILL